MIQLSFQRKLESRGGEKEMWILAYARMTYSIVSSMLVVLAKARIQVRLTS